MQRNGNPRVSVVVPTRNEARNLEVVLPAIAAVRPAVHEIIIVDGNSVDGTVETAQRVLPWVRVITQTRKGKGNAMACGFAASTGDVIVMFDADGSADPAEIPAFVRALIDGADFAKGSRFVRGGGSDDITDSVARLVHDLGRWSGTATVFSRHTTAAIRLQENEPLLLDDLHQLLLRLAPHDADYGHNNFDHRTEHMHPDERPNGHAHCLHLLLGSSEHIPVANGSLMLGEWQRIFLVELDGPRPCREVLVQMTGVMTNGSRW